MGVTGGMILENGEPDSNSGEELYSYQYPRKRHISLSWLKIVGKAGISIYVKATDLGERKSMF